MAKSGGGLVYWPLYGINNIGNMNPGEGYQIKMLAADTLLYPANQNLALDPAGFQNPQGIFTLPKCNSILLFSWLPNKNVAC